MLNHLGRVNVGPLRAKLMQADHAKIRLAINKPTGISSAQALRDLQTHFNPSQLFAPWISIEESIRAREKPNQRNRRNQKKVKVKIGHGGTLDPLATGVLIAGVGKGTKALSNFLECTKTYEAVILFGAATDTYDRVGKLLKKAPYEHVTRELVEKALVQYRGKYMQLPPLFSALKMNGKPLYEYAREGKEIPREIERRPVEVLDLEIVEWMESGTHPHEIPTEEAGRAEINVANKLWKQENSLPASKEVEDEAVENEKALEEFASRKRKLSENQDDLVSERPASKQRKNVPSSQDATMSGGLPPPSDDEKSPSPLPTIEPPTPNPGPPAARLRITATSGFYVRSLCHDLGASVGSAALMAELIRTRQGQFELGKNVLEYVDLAKGEEVWGPKVEAMLDEWSIDKLPLGGTGEKKVVKDKDVEKSVKNEIQDAEQIFKDKDVDMKSPIMPVLT
ncbi:hypothetical protein B7494_g1910 [Chlorociboria aeruginascens]|nr:hypothetical protein B7494_g1910 [Chlorociboria aeruginascens]